MATRKSLDDLLREEADSALLDVKAKTSAQSTEQQRALAAFEEINTFVDRMGFAPGGGGEGRKIGIAERMLQTRLKTYQDDPKMAQALSGADRHGLLLLQGTAPAAPSSMDELLALDDPLLTDPNADLFELRHARSPSAKPDMVSERKPCEDFERFQPLFDAVAQQLATGERKSMKFANEQEIEAGGFFILGGLMVYVAEVRDPHVRNGKRNARLRLIFENGTEGANLLRSLATELYKDPNGRRISDPYAGPLFGPAATTLEHVPNGIERHTGTIYVVKSLSALPQIARLDGQLFKIGFTTGTVEERLRSAAEDPTFLMAPVHPVLTYGAINFNPNKFENLVHRFFAPARLDIEITDRFGKPVRPREWFLLPLSIIEHAIPMILDGSIVHHRYNHRTCAIERIG
jgi:hypothetical protein